MTMTESVQAHGYLQNIFPDGTIQYDDQIGLPEEFPLTEADLNEIELHFSSIQAESND